MVRHLEKSRIVERFPGQNQLFNLQPDQSIRDFDLGSVSLGDGTDEQAVVENINQMAAVFRIRKPNWLSGLTHAPNTSEFGIDDEVNDQRRLVLGIVWGQASLGEYVTAAVQRDMDDLEQETPFGDTLTRVMLRTLSGRAIDILVHGSFWSDEAESSAGTAVRNRHVRCKARIDAAIVYDQRPEII